ncbi:chaperone protein HtpG [Clostridia bacterium]|nr:chaperone protein HtpG [Clostridia bacterium]
MKEFKAESKRLLEMMINSIYTHKEIFLRELISNANDALDKLYYRSLQENLGLARQEFEISVTPVESSRIIKIADNGIGMSREELENNLGVIAKSGSLDFKNNVGTREDMSVIGQFGVGFYSAFMVAKKVEVRTRAYGSDTAYLWTSSGADGYTVDVCSDFAQKSGTEITLYLKDNEVHEHEHKHSADENHEHDDHDEHDHDHEDFGQYLSEYKLKDLIRRYSDYIKYPIKLPVSKYNPPDKEKDGEDAKGTTTVSVETVNSMIPLWKRAKSELTDEDYNKFYKDKFMDYQEPVAVIHSKTEGAATYSALMFIPKKPPYDFYTKEYEKGLSLYSSGVMIMEKCGDLLPDYFSFVKGLVDSDDLSLNISREMLQHDRQLKVIAKSIDRSIRNEFKKLLNNEREKYVELWKEFGTQIKFGVYNNFGQNKGVLQDLLMFKSSHSKDGYTTLAEYIERMPEGQTDLGADCTVRGSAIYYASGDNENAIDKLPQVESVKDKGFEVLYLTDNVDEFCVQVLTDYNGKKFTSVQSADFDVASDEEKAAVKELNDKDKDMFAAMKEALGGEIDVRASKRIKSYSVCLVSSGLLSVEQEKVLNSMPGSSANKATATKVLEVNADSPVYGKLLSLYDNDKDTLAKYSKVLYGQARITEGLSPEDPAEFAKLLTELIV